MRTRTTAVMRRGFILKKHTHTSQGSRIFVNLPKFEHVNKPYHDVCLSNWSDCGLYWRRRNGVYWTKMSGACRRCVSNLNDGLDLCRASHFCDDLNKDKDLFCIM